MTETVTLELPEPLAQQAKEIAALTHRRLEDVLIDLLDRAIADLPIESLSNEQVLALCVLQMPFDQQESLSRLLSRQREESLNLTDTTQLDQLMQIYRRGLIRKARALKVAVERGLRPALSEAQ
jgi:hypothetical protein